MTESEFNESSTALFANIEQLAAERGVAIKRTLSSSALKLEFADGQRIIVARDAQTQKISLASRSGNTEYRYNNGGWLSPQDGSELLAEFAELLNQVVNSNPLNAQPGRLNKINLLPNQTATAPPQPGSSTIKTILVFGLLGWLIFTAFQHYIDSGVQQATQSAGEVSLSNNKCDTSFPRNGMTHIFPASNIQPDNPNNTEVTLQNDHGHPFLATFTAPRTVIPYLSVLVHVGQTAKVGLPPGQYDLLLGVGSSWCNLRTGFSGGERIKLNTTLSVLPEQPVQLIAQSAGTGAAELQIFIKSSAAQTEPPPVQFTGYGVMEIRQHSDGHYHITGTINDAPITFLIDTGASLTSLSPETAKRAGIVDCKQSTFKTANGTVTGCIAPVAQLTLGNYQMQNINVAVMPNMQVDLLGMNVLNHFDMTQANDTMRLSSR